MEESRRNSQHGFLARPGRNRGDGSGSTLGRAETGWTYLVLLLRGFLATIYIYIWVIDLVLLKDDRWYHMVTGY